MLKCEFPNMEIQTVVGTNLSAKRKSGAFHKLFQSLASRLPSDVEHVLLEHVSASVSALIQDTHPVLKGRLTVDDMEHSLCEWVKACRNVEMFNVARVSRTLKPVPPPWQALANHGAAPEVIKTSDIGSVTHASATIDLGDTNDGNHVELHMARCDPDPLGVSEAHMVCNIVESFVSKRRRLQATPHHILVRDSNPSKTRTTVDDAGEHIGIDNTT
jgi:hypothetical protein